MKVWLQQHTLCKWNQEASSLCGGETCWEHFKLSQHFSCCCLLYNFCWVIVVLCVVVWTHCVTILRRWVTILAIRWRGGIIRRGRGGRSGGGSSSGWRWRSYTLTAQTALLLLLTNFVKKRMSKAVVCWYSFLWGIRQWRLQNDRGKKKREERREKREERGGKKKRKDEKKRTTEQIKERSEFVCLHLCELCASIWLFVLYNDYKTRPKCK